MQKTHIGLVATRLAAVIQAHYLLVTRQRCPQTKLFLKRIGTMSSVTTNRVANTGLLSVVSTVMAMLAAWNDARMTRKALSKLSDRELVDIDLCLGDIADTAAAR